jgi:hypothetical protein
MTSSGIEPATCRFVAQCLNHYATACPLFFANNIVNTEGVKLAKRGMKVTTTLNGRCKLLETIAV